MNIQIHTAEKEKRRRKEKKKQTPKEHKPATHIHNTPINNNTITPEKLTLLEVSVAPRPGKRKTQALKHRN